jgi:dCMP deaminase
MSERKRKTAEAAQPKKTPETFHRMLGRALDISVSVKLGSDDAGRLEIVGLDKDDNMAASLERSPWVDPRPSWDEYFLGICEAVSKRSIDSETKHGAVFVDQRHNIVATGYNGPLAGIDDSKVPVTRPAKYPHMAHAEANCVAQAASRGVAVLGSVAYVTGMPCPACMQLMLQSGVARVVCGPRSSACVDEGQRKLSLEKAGAKGVPVEFFGVER